MKKLIYLLSFFFLISCQLRPLAKINVVSLEKEDGLYLSVEEVVEVLCLRDSEISIFDMSGKEVYSKYSHFGQEKIDLSRWGSGVYTIRVLNKKGLKSRTFVVEKSVLFFKNETKTKKGKTFVY